VRCADCKHEWVHDVPGEPCPKCGSPNGTLDPEEIPVFYDDDEEGERT
jgi:hypothetical protein